MITIVHGEDTAASRKYYTSEKEKQPQKVTLDGATLTLTDLLQATSGSGLFGDQHAVFIEELLSKRKPSKELESIQDAILSSEAPIILWESKDLTAKQLSPFKNATVKQFKVPQTVFAFLDSLLPGNGKKSILLFHELLKDEDVNFALFMLERQVRILLALHPSSVILNDRSSSEIASLRSASEESYSKDPSTSLSFAQDDKVISEVKRMAPWQRGKTEKQAKSFSQEQLLSLHEKLFALDFGQKTGALSIPLEQAIDFLLVSM